LANLIIWVTVVKDSTATSVAPEPLSLSTNDLDFLNVSPTFARPFSAGDILSRISSVSPAALVATEVRVFSPALQSVLSKVVVFAIFGATFLRNKQSAPEYKSTARFAL
jgi:hypothetical protein